MVSHLQQLPLRGMILLTLLAGIALFLLGSPDTTDTLAFLSRGLLLTVQISLTAYTLALVIGLIAGLGTLSPNLLLKGLATTYVEVMRGIPILVVILYVAFVIGPEINLKSNFLRVVVALALSYGAYLAEVYRSGIEAIPKGQWEAARALGLSPLQTLTRVVLPQAIKIILPPLGNDFIALIKDSSLATVIGVAELTQQTRLYVSRTFDTFGGWTLAALLYLSITLALSYGVRALEHSQRRSLR